MEAKHGVDISWLHHSHKDAHSSKDLPSTPPEHYDVHAEHERLTDADRKAATAAGGGERVNGAGTSQSSNHHAHRPQLSQSRSAENTSSASPQTPPKGGRDPKGQQAQAPDLKRRASWISNFSSKFSSSSQQTASSNNPSPSPTSPQPAEAKDLASSPTLSSPVSAPRDIKRPEGTSPPTSSPKSGSGSFLSSALRRFSTSGGSTGSSKVNGTGGLCPRKVMNVDPYRERCQMDDLQPAKLRRVSFCVDVEIASPAKYAVEEEESPPPSGRRPSLTQLEKQVEAKKSKEKNVKLKEQAEGAALKDPIAILEKKEHEVPPSEQEQKAEQTPLSNGDQPQNGEVKETTKKKEKKKRSEEERKERKEKKRLAAVANGTIPIEIVMEKESESSGDSTPTDPSTKAQDKPTIDPLRVYRRCCQLRETAVLKRIADQVGSPSACDPAQPGVLSTLDLRSFRIPLADINTLGDYLAIVPVKRLILEDCMLTDEAVRVILAGLLAVKTHDQAKFNHHLSKKLGEEGQRVERLGVIEKLSLKNNPKLTSDGWRHISLFIYMSRSLKAIDLSMIPFPGQGSTSPSQKQAKPTTELRETFERCIATRLAGSRLEELVMAECHLQTVDVEKIVQAVITCGSKRLGLANNALNTESVGAVARYVKTGRCEGLDLGGNDLSENIEVLTKNLVDGIPLYALSLADCNLSASALKPLFPALVSLPNFRFIDLSHNRKLFAAEPNAIFLLRKYLPQMHALKRIHLNDVDMEPEHSIALAEILAEIPYLAHIGVIDNPKLTALAHAKDEVSQEEACAYYASIMAAVRVSRSIVSLDMEMPSSDSTELVKALGKQILAYALRNMERGPAADAFSVDPSKDETLVDVPDILLHLVGHVDGFPENHDSDEPAPSEDYIVSGTGVAKALGIFLGSNSADRRRSTRDQIPMGRGSGASTPKMVPSEETKVKARDTSKNLLDSARKIRARLQPALSREAHLGDESDLKRLQFLDSTLSRMIERFEEEFPECRLRKLKKAREELQSSESGNPDSAKIFTDPFAANKANGDAAEAVEDEEEEADPEQEQEQARHPRHLTRHDSEVSLASRHLANEEGLMHRFGQQMRRSILAPPTFDYHHQATPDEEAEHLKVLRTNLEAMTGQQIKDKVGEKGVAGLLEEIGSDAHHLRLLEQQDPEAFEQLKEAQSHADATLLKSGGGGGGGGSQDGLERVFTGSSQSPSV